MKKNSKKLLMTLLFMLTAIFVASACTSVPEQELPIEQPEEASEETAEIPEDIMADSINLSIALGNNQRTITYQQATPLELPDGTVISQGALKPTWQYIQEQLGIALVDVAIQDQSASDMLEIAAATSFDTAVVYGGTGIAQDLMSYGGQGYFVRLNDHFDQMPNFAAYLNENPNIASSITAYDGGIYHVPYVAEIGNYARVFEAREAWVLALLDRKDSREEETHTLTPVYEGYWDRHATNVVDLQNEAANGTLTRDIALDTLLDYIAETYPNLNTPSELYLNETAQYDIDELIALWRVVELSPNTLSKVSHGAVVEGADITPFFVRKSSYREDVLRLVPYFGGQRVYGSDSYGARFYLDADGELQYSYAQDEFLQSVEYISQLYAEGLIHSEFADLSTRSDFRNPYYGMDTQPGHNQYGFMTFDWIASTTASNPDVVGILPPLTTVGSDEFIHFVENTRVIKPDGWAISVASSEAEIKSALALFDYFFTDEGHIVQNYGPPFGLEDGALFTAANGIRYPQFNQWLLGVSCQLKNCDMSGFLRDFMGSHIPIGYQKEIGFEFQYTKNRGWDAWALYIGNDVASVTYESDDPAFRLVPPVISFTEQETARLSQLSIGEDQTDQIFLYITGADTAVDSPEALQQLFIDAGLEEYVDVYRNAYTRMINQ